MDLYFIGAGFQLSGDYRLQRWIGSRLRRKVKTATQAVAWPLLFCAAKKVSKKGGLRGDGGFPRGSPNYMSRLLTRRSQ